MASFCKWKAEKGPKYARQCHFEVSAVKKQDALKVQEVSPKYRILSLLKIQEKMAKIQEITEN